MSAKSALPPRIIFVKSGGGGGGREGRPRHIQKPFPFKTTRQINSNCTPEKLARNTNSAAGLGVCPQGVLGAGNARAGEDWEVISMFLCWSLFSRSSVAWPEPPSMPAEVS